MIVLAAAFGAAFALFVGMTSHSPAARSSDGLPAELREAGCEEVNGVVRCSLSAESEVPVQAPQAATPQVPGQVPVVPSEAPSAPATPVAPMQAPGP